MENTQNITAENYILAGLMSNPLLFIENEYKFSINDFDSQFHRIVFGAIEHLAKNGIEEIGYIDIDQFIKPYDRQYKVFKDNNGVNYLQDILHNYDGKKFKYYYNILKKYSLVRHLSNAGFDMKDVYNPNILDQDELSKMYERFDSLSVDDILLDKETKFIVVKEQFESNVDRVENNIGDNLYELIDELKGTPEVGLPFKSQILTTIYRGMRKGCVYMTSAPSGQGKTRYMVGNATFLSVPEYYDIELKKWITTGMNEPVLLIETELELREIQTMALASVSGVPETHILDGKYFGDEEERVKRAAKLIKENKLYLVAITNYDTDDLIHIIKKYYQIHNVQYVFYDYLSENLKILAEGARKSRVSGLRTDQILLSMITSLKDCAKTLDIYIETSTQLSGDFKNATELDASYLRSAKSLSDKIDVGGILMPVKESDQEVIATYCNKGFELVPNFVISVYKIRRGIYQNIKVYVYFDRSTCHIYDCFVTDNKGQILDNVVPMNIELILDQTKEKNFSAAFAGDENAEDISSQDDEEIEY